MAHGNDHKKKIDMEVDEDMGIQLQGQVAENEDYYGYNSYLPNGTNQPIHHWHPSQIVSPPQIQQYTSYYAPTAPPPRTYSGESQRSQTRRFAAGHAEMQRSAYISTQNEQDARSSNKSKFSPMMEANATEDSSMAAYYDTQPPKRPRRYTKDPKES